MDMIRHDHIAPDPPVVGGFPCLKNGTVNSWAGENLLPLVCADGKENDGGFIVPLNGRMVRGVFAVRQWRDAVLIVRGQRGRCPST